MLRSLDFATRRALVEKLPVTGDLQKEHLIHPDYRLIEDRELAIYDVPFDHINLKAKVIFVGITPGWAQFELAYRGFRDGIRMGLPEAAIYDRIDEEASFAGAMRKNLVAMLDELELPACLGVPDSSVLFTSHRRNFTHTTSALRYPVFVRGKNYNGHSPNPLQKEILLHCIKTILAPEIEQIPGAIVVPLGKAVSQIIEWLATNRLLDRRRCLLGFPHPSGANGHRKKHFAANYGQLRRGLGDWFVRV